MWCLLAPYRAALWVGFRLPILCVLQFVGVGVGTCSRHSLHHTNHTGMNTPRILDLSTCANWANICVDLPTEVSQLFTYYVCRFLVLAGQHNSDWGFSFINHSGMWILGHFWFNESANGWLYKVSLRRSHSSWKTLPRIPRVETHS